MNDEELEQKSIEYELKVCGVNANQKLRQAYMDGFRDCLGVKSTAPGNGG